MNTSNELRQSTSSPRNLQQMMRQHPLFSFFLLAYAFSWILSIPFILSQWNILPNVQPYQIFFIIKSFGPALAAYIMCRVTEGQAGWQYLRSLIRQWRVGWQWYLVILLGVPALMLLGIAVLPGAVASFSGVPPNFLISYLISFILIFFGGGPLGEEPGWRGFALPRLQSRYGALRANLLLGILWTCWHLPDFLTVAQKGGPGADLSILFSGFLVFLLEVMALTFIFTWVFNHTGGSVFIAILLHTSYNTFGNAVQPLFPASIVTTTDLPFVIAVVVPALLILILTRGRLGY
jgi:membrane protease YdiL (CAAX protease family)